MTEEESETKIWYHLDRVTITINVTTPDETAKWRMLELKTQEFEEMFYCLKYPLYSLWHEVYPNYSNVYNLTMWDPVNPEFDNCNGVLDHCDNLTLMNLENEAISFWHVEEVAVDMVVTETPIHDVAVISVSSLYPQVNQGEVDPINVTVENQGDFSETVDVYAFYDGNLAAPKQTIVLNPGEHRTLTFNWNTTDVPLGTYTISANATIPIDDDPLDNYLSDGEQEVIPELPSIIVLPLFMLSTLAVTAFKLKKKKR